MHGIQCLSIGRFEFIRTGDARTELAHQPITEAIGPAVHRQRLAARPRILHHCGLADVDHLLDHVDLAETVVAFAFVVDADVPAATVLKAAGSADKTLISDINLFDVFEAEHVGAGKKSVAIEVTLQPRGKTLTDEEIDAVSKALVAAVEKATGGVLRT